MYRTHFRGSVVSLLTAAGGVLLLVAATLATGGQPAFALTNCSVSSYSLDSEEQAFLGLINDYRADNGLGSLSVSTNLNRAAHWMS
ncbi:MAG: hypothetical protein U5Q44_13680 [Dehalococcoidia bacterium]|nr:hypothetical protein [Dehalococcoidia bacterium]